jgi:hypothetical protein
MQLQKDAAPQHMEFSEHVPDTHASKSSSLNTLTLRSQVSQRTLVRPSTDSTCRRTHMTQ